MAKTEQRTIPDIWARTELVEEKTLAEQKRVREIKRAVRKTERASNNGGTGATILKMERTPVAKLIEKGSIGPQELQAAVDISTAFHALAGALMFRPVSYEKRDPSHSVDFPAKTADAIRRYQKWANHWSVKAKRGDKSLSITVAAVVDERPIRAISEDENMHHSTVERILVAALDDYAMQAGWKEKR